MKNVIITGTSSGIGLELVKIFSKEDFNVISLSRSDLSFKPLMIEDPIAPEPFTIKIFNY